MKKTAAADVVIFGGGVAGLWLLNRLRETGLSALLFESASLGGGQTCKAQGIVHGGAKYALQGVMTSDAKAINAMPQIWRECLAGIGQIDLSGVSVLSTQHCLWSPNKFTSKLAGFFASAALTSKVTSLAKENYPAVFKHREFKGEVFSVDEIVIDVPDLIRELAKNNQDAIFKIEPLTEEALRINENGQMQSATVYFSEQAVDVHAQHFIFTAGAGNELIIKKLKTKEVAMQRRPLHMVLVKTPFSLPLYAHCLGLGTRPRVTITTHFIQDGSTIWYLGGLLAEEGITRDQETQIKEAKKELALLFPWLNLQDAEFSTFMIDRAEPEQKGGLKPDTVYLKTIQNVSIAWPTKMVLAPKLADEIILALENAHLTPQLLDIRQLRAWPMPPLARPVWEDAFCKSVA